MSSFPPDPGPTIASAGVDAVVLGDWPERLRVLLLNAALDLAGPHDRDTVLQRAELVEGSLSITSTPGNGTVVLLEVSRG